MDTIETTISQAEEYPLQKVVLPAMLWDVVAVAIQGTSHQKINVPCQDAVYWQISPKGTLVIAIADGAGSASLAEIGAEIVVRQAVDHLCSSEVELADINNLAWQEMLMGAFRSALAAVVAEADARQMPLREFASTLIVTLSTPDFVLAGHIGDGASVVGDDEGNVYLLTGPQNGEYANETTFLVSPDALATIQLVKWPKPARHLALFSDGLQMLALTMPVAHPHAPFFSPLFRFVSSRPKEGEAQLRKFLTTPPVTDRVDDDLSLVLAVLIDGKGTT